MSNPIHNMIDIETLSQHPTAAIVSIGGCKMNVETGEIFSKFHVNVDPLDCKKYGLRIDQSTIDWWRKSNPEAMKIWRENGLPLQEALDKFKIWHGPENSVNWAYGSNFDFPILTNAMSVLDMKEPWKYWNLKCARTVLSLAGINLKELRESTKADTMYHSASDDAVFQAEYLMKLLYTKK